MKIFFATLALLISIFASSAEANDPIGQTIKATGSTAALRLDHIYAQRKNDPVFWQDELQTGAASRMEVTFKDGTHLYLGDHSKLRIDELVYEPNEKGQALFTLSEGVFRMVSGALNKIKDSKFEVRTPLATIGVRGTDFWGLQTADKLTMALIDNGQITIAVGDKTITLSDPLQAIVIEKGKPLGTPFKLTEEQFAQARKTIE